MILKVTLSPFRNAAPNDGRRPIVLTAVGLHTASGPGQELAIAKSALHQISGSYKDYNTFILTTFTI